MKAKKRFTRGGPNLSWFRKRSDAVAAALLPLFISATLYPSVAAAQSAQGPAPSQNDDAYSLPAARDDVTRAATSTELASSQKPTASVLESQREKPLQKPAYPAGAPHSQQAVIPSGATPATNGGTPPSTSGAGAVSSGGSTPTGGGTITGQAISLPSGAATMGGMGESFTAQLTTGVAIVNIPFALPSGRAGLAPALSISYSSSGGYGVAGVGWSLAGTMAIVRQSDRGIPSYDDRDDWHPEQDRFICAGQELVPICKVTSGACAGALAGEAMPGWSEGWQYFRARVEGAFLRFFWSPDHLTWRVQSKDGMNFELGLPLDGSQYLGGLERNPQNERQIYGWQVVRQYDAHGNPNATPPAPTNTVVFRYLQDGNLAYLSDVYYTPPANDPAAVDLARYAHHVALSYEDRPDRNVTYRSGWLLEQRIRLAGIDITSKSFQGSDNTARQLVRRFHLGYVPNVHASLLESLAVEGRCESTVAEDEDGKLPRTSCPRFPPLTLEYQRLAGDAGVIVDSQGLEFERFSTTLRDVDASPPYSIGSVDSLSGLIDVNSDGLPDLVVTSPNQFGGQHGVYLNRGESDGKLRFAAVEPMAITGVKGVDGGVLNLGNSNVGILDLDGNGTAELVHMPMVKRYSVFAAEKQASGWAWSGRNVATASGQNFKIDFAQNARRTAVMDVNGDGLVDVVFASATEYQTFFALGRYPGGEGQFGFARWTSAETADLSNDPITTCVPWSADPVRLGDSDVRVGDLNGDGLPDIVRMRSGQLLYWPGRGNGFWGTGEPDQCKAGAFGKDEHIEMANAPNFGTAQPGTLDLADVNGDGLADVVEIRADAVDVYLNENGLGFTDRLTLSDVPFRPNNSSPVRLTDINGSGSTDILWGTAREYHYIDLTNGVRPYLLTKLHNGLGKSTEFDYRSSTALMVDAEAAGQPWSSVSPLPTAVLVRSTASDNLDKVGRPAGRTVTEYSYRDAVFEGRQREFRGFRSAETRVVGDANGPTSVTRSTHLLGECESGQSGLDVCSFGERWRDNWREPLKGLPVLSETFNEQGVYLGTEHREYELRQLYAGRDGRRVSIALPTGEQGFHYDTAAFDGTSSLVSLPEVTIHLAGVEQSETRSVLRRATQGTARIDSSTAYDDFGNPTSTTSFGCVEGCGTPDEAITSHNTMERVAGDGSGWLFRPSQSFVTGNIYTARRAEVRHEYDSHGDLERSFAKLSGTLPLDRFHQSNAAVAPTPPHASGGVSEPVEIQTVFFEHDDFGNVIGARGPPNGCRSVVFASDYADLPISETTFGGDVAADGCGARAFETQASYDRGLELLVDVTDITGQPAHFDYDGFGRRVAETYADPQNPGQLATLPGATYQYILPADWTVTPYSVLVTRTQNGATTSDSDYSETIVYGDGLRRTLVVLSEADPSAGDGGSYIASGLTDYTAKGAPLRMFENRFWSGDPLAYPLAEAPALRYSSQRYDAFGRSIESYGLDGETKLATAYHALSTDHWDAADLTPGPHAGSYSTVRSDGHGRQVEMVARVHVSDALEERRLLSDYLPTGELRRVIRRRAGSADVVRWFQYDSLGRLVLNVEPNTSVGFNADPDTDPATIKALRYAYNDGGGLVGTSDARGCGVNYYYDAAGRLTGEDYSPCTDGHQSYSPPDASSGSGFEVFYRYDTADPDSATIADAAGRTLAINGNSLWGRTSSIADLGQKAVFSYDARGRSIGVARRMVKPGVPSSAPADRYAPRWYIQEGVFDAAGRSVVTSTGASSPELLGADGRSVVQNVYSARGILKNTTSSYGALLQGQTVDANGLPHTLTLADGAHTERSYEYDGQDRLASVHTYRGTPALWSEPALGTPSSGEPTQQLLLEDYDFSYDVADNITEIRDYRIADEWPDSAKPVTRRYEYDDLYRVTRATYEYTGGTDTWKSPFAAENGGLTAVETNAKPSPHVNFTNRVLEQRYEYDHLGNTTTTTDDSSGFFDRSLGTIQNGTANVGPEQLRGASNRNLTPASSRAGDLDVAYDASGSVTDLVVRRDGPCLPAGASCWQRFRYDWDELGQLARARRWDLTASAPDERGAHGALTAPLPLRAPDVELRYAYAAGGERVLKTAADPTGNERHTVYIFGTLELRRSTFDGGDYLLSPTTENVLLNAGVNARVVYSEEDLPSLVNGGRHVFLLLNDYLGSNTFVIDHETGELVEHSTYQAYGSTESDYRPGRWGNFREPVKFTGKEEDVEVGLTYFGARYLSLGLGRWMSVDPATIHDLKGDLNPYAYVAGRPTIWTDPDGRIIPLIVAAIIIGAVIGGGVGGATYAATAGSQFSWVGLAGAVGLGALGGAAGAGVGSVVTGAIGGGAGALLGAAAGGAVSGGIGYGGGAGLYGYSLSWGGFGMAVGIGAASGIVFAGADIITKGAISRVITKPFGFLFEDGASGAGGGAAAKAAGKTPAPGTTPTHEAAPMDFESGDPIELFEPPPPDPPKPPPPPEPAPAKPETPPPAPQNEAEWQPQYKSYAGPCEHDANCAIQAYKAGAGNRATPVESGTSKAPLVGGKPNSIYEQTGPNGEVRSRTLYDENGNTFSRQDYDHSHAGMQPHEHLEQFNANQQRIAPRTVRPLPRGYPPIRTKP